jgi:hypothetical protein
VRFLGVRGEERQKNLGQTGELVLGDGIEQRHGGQVNGIGGIACIGNNDSLGGALVALEVDLAEQIRGVGEISLLLGLAQTGTTVGLILAIGCIGSLKLSALLPEFLYPLGLRLLVGGGEGLGFGLSFGGLLDLLALYLGVFGGVP